MMRWAIFTAAILATPPAAAATTADRRFTALYTAEYAWRLNQQAPDEDNKAVPPRLPDVGPAAQAARLQRWTATAAALAAIRVADLSPAQRVNYAVYKGQIDALLAEQRYREYEKPLTADTSFWGDLAEASRSTFATADDARAYIAMLRDMPRYFDQQIANMRSGLKRGFTAPRVTLTGRDAGVALVAEAATAEVSPFYAPFGTLPAQIPPATQAALRAEGAAAIRDAVVPAHARLLAFLRTEYIPGARTTLAAYDLPDGRAYYQSKVAEYTTLDQTPAQIHAIGLAEVAKIRARMQAVMTQVGFAGDLPAFLHFLRTDPRFYAKTPQDLLDRAAWLAKTFDGKAAQYFGRLPRSRFAIRPVPADIAPFYTSGRGGPGIYLVNTYNLPSRALYSLPALTLHESAPGHAFQMPLAAENTGLPAFRRDTYLSAYGEGWALYCEALGEEMGMYETPYDLFGMLSYQMWRAARLVVDTGIHTQGWTRERAQRYLHDNTALADHEIETEVDRYIAWPGQALSYYTGELAFLAARRKAEAALGTRFDVRAFHDAVLALGSVPLSEIDRRVDQLIRDGGRGHIQMRNARMIVARLALLALLFPATLLAQSAPVAVRSDGNPILSDGRFYSTDPAPVVDGDTLYILAGRDEAPPGVNDFIMNEWQLLSTKDPASREWRHYPAIARPETVFAWAEPGRAYAGQIVKGVDGRFYLYAPVLQRDSAARDRFAIGVAVAASPVGPWTDAHPAGPIVSQTVPVANDMQNIDPTVLVDDDGRVFLYWGTFGQLRGMELRRDMVTPAGPETPMEGLTGFFEAAWIMKRKGVYYMLYAGNNAGPDSDCTPAVYHACQAYGTATSPLGPWTYRGVLLRPVSSTTSHAGAVEFKGKWYLAYHTADATGGGHFRRSVALDRMAWDDSVKPAAIRPVVATHAPRAAPAPTRNIAAAASAASSNRVPLQYWIAALNDGKVRDAPLPPDMWGTWAGDDNPARPWIEYRWDAPVRIDGARMYFFADQPAGSGVGVAPPAAWHIEYWDRGWKPVRGASGYGTVPGAFQDVDFEAVVTRCLRAVFDASADGGKHAGVGVQEWEVLAPAAAVPVTRSGSPAAGCER